MRSLLAAVLLAGLAARLPAADPLDGFDDAVKKAMKLHSVPGLGVAIVKDGKVVLAKGYGLRAVGTADAVTADTVFAIGSVSKSFTAAAAAMYVDAGKLKWDDRIKDHVANFEMKDPYLTNETRLRDTLSHRVGLDRHDMVWYGSSFTTPQLLGKLKDMKPAYSFRTNFVYNNLLFMVAGEAVAKVAGKPWDEVVQEKIFSPLGMTTANTSPKKFLKDGDVASPHERQKQGRPLPVPWLNLDAVGAAGSINASAADMAKYVQFQLSRGKAGDKRLLKADVFREMHKPQMLTPKELLFNPDPKSASYGLGWFLTDYHGRTLVEHGGNVDGMTAQVGFLPEENLGVVFLANLGASALPAALMYDTFDRYLGRPVLPDRVEGTSLLMWMMAAGTRVAGVKFDEAKRQKDAKPPTELKNFAGKWEDSLLYAPVEIKLDGEKLKLKWTNFAYDLEYWQFGSFRGTDPNGRWPSVGLHFTLDENGRPTELKLAGLNVDDVRFKKGK